MLTVCLTFDVDAMSGMVYEGERSASALSVGEFGADVGVPRLLRLLRAHELPATFFVPGHTADCFPQSVEAILAGGHELGHHGYLHEPPARLSAEAEEEALARGTASLERIAGERPLGYRAPLFEASTRTIGLLERAGFRYDSSLMATDFMPYFARAGDQMPEGGFVRGRQTAIVELPASWIFDDWSHFANVWRAGEGGVTPASQVFEIWSEQVAFALDSVPDGVVVFTMHPQVSGNGYVLRMLERLIAWMSDEPRLSFARMRDAAASARERLRQGAAAAE